MKKVIAFDLDGTLAASKSAMDDRMGKTLAALLEYFEVCVISGGAFKQFQEQLLANLHVEPAKLQRMHLMPTCGTRYYRYDTAKADWDLIYAEDLTAAQKNKIAQALADGAQALGLQETTTYGEIIEDRQSQMSFSAYGQDVVTALGPQGLELKERWDPDNKKKQALRDHVAQLIPEFEVRVGGLTTVDVTLPGIDKAYGMQKLVTQCKVAKEDILFFGDRLSEGGNDYPVKAMGIDALEVSRWQDTVLALEAILAIL